MTRQEIVARLAEEIVQIAGGHRGDVSADKTFAELDVDELSLVELAVAAELRFRVHIPDGAISALTTVGAFAEFILAASSSGQEPAKPAVRLTEAVVELQLTHDDGTVRRHRFVLDDTEPETPIMWQLEIEYDVVDVTDYAIDPWAVCAPGVRQRVALTLAGRGPIAWS